MKTTNTTNSVSILAALSPEQLAALTPEQLAALAGVSVTTSLETPEAPKPEAPKTPQAPKPKTPKPEAAPAGEWATWYDGETWRMNKAKNLPADAQHVMNHKTQGKALQALNSLRKGQAESMTEAPAPAETAPEAPKTEAPAPEVITADLDERAARIAKRNAAIIATIPRGEGKDEGAARRLVENKLKQAHAAGYPYARLARNKNHQLDGLHLYPGQKGHGRDAAFRELVTKAGEKYRAKADKARAEGKPAPKQPTRVWYWSPVGGGNLYIRGIFGEVTDA